MAGFHAPAADAPGARRPFDRFAAFYFAYLVVASVALVAAAPATAIRDAGDPALEALRDGLDRDEQDALDTLALADASLRDAILEGSLYPSALASLSAIQERSSRAFRQRLERESRGTQKDAWELIRYPELLDRLVVGGRPARAEVDDIVAPHPERVGELARGLALHHFALLADIAAIREEAERENRLALSGLPLATQAGFEALIERPDLLSALLREPAVAERLADLVRADAWNARTLFDREHARLFAERERELDAWRETIESDPEAERELRESAERFAEEEGYEAPDHYVETRTEVHHVYHHPYPWWFGPPRWQLGWHWYPVRTHWGFHISLGGGLRIHSVPSPTFSYWHYRRPPAHRQPYRHLHGHWSRYGVRHHLHRDYPHRFHHRKGHRYHDPERRSRHGHRDRPHVRRPHRPTHGSHTVATRHTERTNRFFRHDTVKTPRAKREGPRRRVARDEMPRSKDERHAERRRSARRQEPGSRTGERTRVREPSREDEGRKATSRRKARPSRERSKTTLARRSDREAAGKTSSRFSGESRRKKVEKKRASTRSKASPRKSSPSRKVRKQDRKKRKKKGVSTNKFFARR